MSDRLAPNPLDRAELISLLETLGSDNDEEVLAAARVLDTKVTAAGASWNVLLTTRIGETADEAGDEDGDAAPAPGEPLPADEAQRNAESLTLIERLLARSGQSEALREELEGYRSDIAAGEFTDADHKYLRALYKRLSA
ncbi:MAG TPA: hypothetical protein VIS03_18935 [Kiloniellaceae bacterium]